MLAALAIAAPTAAPAETVMLSLTGMVSSASTGTFLGTYNGQPGTYRTLNLALSGFDPFVLNVGDDVQAEIVLDQFLEVPGAFSQLLGFDIFREEEDTEVSSDTYVTFADGDFVGQTFGGGCTNCLSAIFGQDNGAAYSFSTLTASILLTSASGPVTITGAQLSYQLFDPEAAVPEPASWALMITGFGLVGGVMRRRARTGRVVAA